MSDLGKNHSSKESDNKDKSLHGLMVALAIAGAIAGSAILFAYASSDGSLEAAGTATSDAPAPEPEPVIAEKVVEKPIYIERIKYINQTIEVEKPVYINRTVEVEKQVPVYIEKEIEKPVYIYVNNTEDDSQNARQSEPDAQETPAIQEPNPAQEQMYDGLSDEQDIIPERVLDLLDNVVNFDEDEKEDDDGNKGKGNNHNDDD